MAGGVSVDLPSKSTSALLKFVYKGEQRLKQGGQILLEPKDNDVLKNQKL